jgi:two-component system response regulator
MGMITVLHVEDDLDAAFFLKRAVEKANLPGDLKHLKDGEEAISHLEKPPSLPDIIFLDLKMPFKDGFEVLAWIKQTSQLSHVPVIILTSSDRDEDLQRAQSMGATAYLTKTVTFSNVVETISEFLKQKLA